jgi:hypothetical protein
MIYKLHLMKEHRYKRHKMMMISWSKSIVINNFLFRFNFVQIGKLS